VMRRDELFILFRASAEEIFLFRKENVHFEASDLTSGWQIFLLHHMHGSPANEVASVVHDILSEQTRKRQTSDKKHAKGLWELHWSLVDPPYKTWSCAIEQRQSGPGMTITPKKEANREISLRWQRSAASPACSARISQLAASRFGEIRLLSRLGSVRC